MKRHLLTALYMLCSLLLQAQPVLKQSFGVAGRAVLSADVLTEVADLQVTTGDSLWLLAYCGHADTAFYDMDVALLKLDPSGNRVNDFAQNGVLRFDFDGMDFSTARQLIVCSNGQLLVLGTGYALSDPSYAPFCIARLNADGTPDLSFGFNGTAKIGFYGGQEYPGAYQVDAQGRLLLAGGSYDTLGSHNVPVLGRFSSAALPDSSFGTTGKQVIDFTLGLQAVRLPDAPQHLTGGEAYDLLPLADGSLLACGSYGPDCFLAHLKANGTLDSSFYATGYNVFHIEAPFNNRVDKMQLLPDGTVLLGISVDKSSDRDYYLVRVSPVNGAVLGSDFADFGGNEDWLNDMALAPSGAVVIAGHSESTAHLSVPGCRSDWFTINLVSDYTQLALQQKFCFGFDTTHQSGAAAVAVQSDGTIVCAGFVLTDTPGESNAALVALDASNYLSSIAQQETVGGSISVFPNPAQESVTVAAPASATAFILRDESGRQLLSQESNGEARQRIDLQAIPAGFYLLQVTGNFPGAGQPIKIIRTH